MSFTKNMLEQFADNPGLKRLQGDVNIFDETVKDAIDKGYKPEYINELKETLTAATIANYENFRDEELSRLEQEAAEIEKQYNKKMVLSPEARRDVEILEKSYAALSDNEIEQKYNDYINFKINNPIEHEVLSRQLRERKSPNFENFRKHYKERGDDRPHEKLNPDLFKYQRDLKNIKHGETLIHVIGTGQDGQIKRIPQAHSIRDLLKN